MSPRERVSNLFAFHLLCHPIPNAPRDLPRSFFEILMFPNTKDKPPSDRRRSIVSELRSVFLLIMGVQYDLFVFGATQCSGLPYQKHPLTKTAAITLGKTMSALQFLHRFCMNAIATTIRMQISSYNEFGFCIPTLISKHRFSNRTA